MNSDTELNTLNDLEDTRRAMLDLLANTRRSVHLYASFLDPRLYNDTDVTDAIRTRIVEQSRIRIYLLLPPAHDWRRACPRLLQLSERLSSAIELRTPPRDEPRERPEFTQSFMIADESILLHETDPRRHLGKYAVEGAGDIRKLMNFFMEIWEKSQPDLELRQLKL